tara:strand:+ start:976 stop:2292 length:1317 start_codon:yes stop_codon:yes gene_type:complete
MFVFLRNILILIILILPNYALSLDFSSYLVANSAINLLDFDKASEQFEEFNKDLNESDLHNQLLTYINLGLILESNFVAKEIIKINKLNQEAWIVHLSYSIINGDLSILREFKIIQKKSNMDLLNYIFFSKDGNVNNKELISKSILEVVQALYDNKGEIDYKFLLFYLSIATIINPNFGEAYFFTAQIYQLLNNYPKAQFLYEQIPSDHNLFLDSQKNIAINKSKVGLENEGVLLLSKLLDSDKENFNLILALADLYRIQKKYTKAIDYYSKLISSKNNLFKDYWRLYYLRGICYERLNNWEFAEKDFLYSLNLKSNSPQVLNYLAYGWLERELFIEDAFIMLEEAYQANPNSYYIADSLAWAFYKKNELIKAAELMEKVISIAPGEVISLDHLGDIYFAMNRKREASYFWKQALDLAEPSDEIIDKLIKKLEIYYEG